MKEMRIEGKRKEKWVQICQIQGFEDVRDCYYLSNNDEDKVINRNTGKQLKIGFASNGYKKVGLMTIDGKTRNCHLHVLKASAFIHTVNPLGTNIVRHLNDIKTDNRLSNLAWGSYSDNIKDSILNGHFNHQTAIKNLAKGHVIGGKVAGKINGTARAKITSKPVRCIETGISYPSIQEASRQTGVASISISHCCNGKYKTAGKYHWEFVDKQE